MASLAKTRIPSFYLEIGRIASELAEAIVEERAKSLDGLIIRAYFLVKPEAGGTTAREIASTISSNFEVDTKPERVGKRIGPFGFQRSRGKARLFQLPREMWVDMARKYLPKDEREEVLSKLGVEPTNAEIAEAIGLAPSKSPVGGDKLTGAKNLKAISDHIRNRLRWDSSRPDSWIARDALLAFWLPENSQPDLNLQLLPVGQEFHRTELHHATRYGFSPNLAKRLNRNKRRTGSF